MPKKTNIEKLQHHLDEALKLASDICEDFDFQCDKCPLSYVSYGDYGCGKKSIEFRLDKINAYIFQRNSNREIL